MGKKFLPVLVFAKIAIRRAFRDKTAIFFVIIFPLIFLFVFGGIFGRSNGTSFKVALLNQSQSDFSKQFVEQSKQNPLFKVDAKVSTLDEAKEKMSRGQLDAAIVLPENFGDLGQNNTPSGKATVYFNQNSDQAGQAIGSILDSQFQSINSQFVDVYVPFTVTAERLTTKGLSTFDYVFAGLLGFSIVGIGIFGPVNVFPELKKQGVLRRLHTTPLRVWQYFLANVGSQSVVGLVSIAVQFVVAILVFNLNVAGNYLALAAFIVLSIATILGIGLAVGGWARNEQQAAPLANLIVFPMLFLSGTFFPRFLMPEWLQSLSAFLPLTPVIEGIRLIVTEGKTLIDIAPQVGLLAGWCVVIYAIAFRVFRWE